MRRIFCVLLAMMLLTPLMSVFSENATPVYREISLRDGTHVRVKLSRLNVTDRMDLKLGCGYLLSAGANTAYFPADADLTILLRDQELLLYYNGMAMAVGDSLKLCRAQPGELEGFSLLYQEAVYPGDLILTVKEDTIQPVLDVDVEDYLLGVVPYEMGDSFPLEALKAQAVAARTYALRRKGSNTDYDVLDTTADQVYRGYLTGNPLSEQAVRETAGICGYWRDAFAQCYYSASNGGQTEKNTFAWPEQKVLPYTVRGSDPYDLANPKSSLLVQEISKTDAPDEPFLTLLRETLTPQLQAKNLKPETLLIEEITGVEVCQPDAEGSLYVKTLRITAKVSAEREFPPDSDTEEVELNIELPTAKQAIQTPAVTPDPIRQTEILTAELEIFPTAEKALGLNLSAYSDSELWSVIETEDAFRIEVRRYGHGVGMSQRGAEMMARQEQSFEEIFAFYYPGVELVHIVSAAGETEIEGAARLLLESPGEAPTPTPRPTPIPLTVSAGKGESLAEVSNIADGTTLNMRALPSLGGDVLTRLMKYQQVLILTPADEEGWVKVRLNELEGFVLLKYLQKIQ